MPRGKAPSPPGELTKREREVASRLALGATNSEIGKALEISIKTVDTHRGHLLKKLGIRNNAELAIHAVKTGLVEVDGLYTQDQLDARIQAEIDGERASADAS